MLYQYKNEEDRLQEIEVILSAELMAHLESVLKKFSVERNKDLSIHSLHGTIGGKNNKFTDVIHQQFINPNEFKASWLKGFNDFISTYKYYSPLKNLLRDEEFLNYTFTFLERNFYRNFIARTRFKPDESLWSIWFGSGNMPWGLVIAPTFRNNSWTNDVSEVRRAKYMYWTIGHVMSTGLIDPNSPIPIRFNTIDELLTFYRSVLKRVSNSLYERQFCDLYISYIISSTDPMQEPFLIPEMRYAGLKSKHEYRLDFTILNSHTFDMIGIELSPNSTHMAVKNIKDRLQKNVNAELAEKWAKEMTKRNNYFTSFGITTYTFTDTDLVSIERCFEILKKYLSKRPLARTTLNEEIERLNNL